VALGRVLWIVVRHICYFIGFFCWYGLHPRGALLLPDSRKALAMSELVSGRIFYLISLGHLAGPLLGGRIHQKFGLYELYLLTIHIVAALLLLYASVKSFGLGYYSALLLGLFVRSLLPHRVIPWSPRLHATRRSNHDGLMRLYVYLGTRSTLYICPLLNWTWLALAFEMACKAILAAGYALVYAARRVKNCFAAEAQHRKRSYSEVI